MPLLGALCHFFTLISCTVSTGCFIPNTLYLDTGPLAESSVFFPLQRARLILPRVRFNQIGPLGESATSTYGSAYMPILFVVFWMHVVCVWDFVLKQCSTDRSQSRIIPDQDLNSRTRPCRKAPTPDLKPLFYPKSGLGRHRPSLTGYGSVCTTSSYKKQNRENKNIPNILYLSNEKRGFAFTQKVGQAALAPSLSGPALFAPPHPTKNEIEII